MFTNKMIWQIDEYMLYCQSKQLSEKPMESYEQTLHLFERWCGEEMLIENVTEITEGFIRRYINDLQTRGKYMACCNDGTKEMNCPERRRDFRQPVSVTTIKDYSTDAVLFYPGLSYAFFSVLENKCAIFHLKYMKLHGNMKLIRLLLCMDTILSEETCLKSEMVVL